VRHLKTGRKVVAYHFPVSEVLHIPPRPRVPSYRRHTSGQATVRLNGRDFYPGVHGTANSRREYDRLINEWLANGRRLPTLDNDDELTIVELIAEFWKYARKWYVKNGKPTTEQDCYKIALRYLRRDYGELPVTQFSPRAPKAIRQEMIDRGNARTYINDQIARLKRVFRWGVEEELVPVSVSQALDAVKGLMKGRCEARETDPVTAVSDDVVNATIKHMPKVVADMVRLQRLTGARPDEICALRSADADRTGDVWKYTPQRHKNEHHDKCRHIMIGPQAQAILAPRSSPAR
jgi:integrase